MTTYDHDYHYHYDYHLSIYGQWLMVKISSHLVQLPQTLSSTKVSAR